MAISKIQLPSNSVEDIHDARIPAPASADNSKVLGVTDTSGTLGWVAQSGGSSNAVLYTAQSLTDAQKAQARSNIGTLGYEVNGSAQTGTLNFEVTSNKVTSISSVSTNDEYPSAKCVYDIIGNVESLLAAI